MHDGNKSNKCNKCNFASSRAGNLRKHLKTQCEEKSNNCKCSQCAFIYFRADYLRRHLKTDSGEKFNKFDFASYQATWLFLLSGRQLVAFVWLFSTVSFQMSPQIVFSKKGKGTLVAFAFVWLFYTVCFQMCLQIACPRKDKVPFVTFFRIVSTVCFQMCPQMVRGEQIIRYSNSIWIVGTE